MTNNTQALYDARELAMERMQVEATELHAEDIVGVQIHENQSIYLLMAGRYTTPPLVRANAPHFSGCT